MAKVGCPECGSQQGRAAQVSRKKDEGNPWSLVLKVYFCESCKRTVPAHLWERWDGLSESEAKTEWQTIYQARELSEDEDLPKVLFNKIKNSSDGLPDQVTVNGLTLVYKEVKSVSCGHGYAIAHGRAGPDVAYMDGYRFPKDKPVIIEILGPDSKIWSECGLAYEKDIIRVRKVIESLVDENGTLRVHPNKKLSGGFRIYGGF